MSKEHRTAFCLAFAKPTRNGSGKQRLQEASLVKDYRGVETQVIDPAEPGKKIFPNTVLLLLESMLFGALDGSGLAWVAESGGADH